MASYLSSVLKSIGATGDSKGSSTTRPPPLRANGAPPVVAGVKRKAEGDLQAPGDKAQKIGNSASTSLSREIKALPRRSVASTTFSTPNRPTNGANPQTAPAGLPATKSSISGSNGRSATANFKSVTPTARAVTASSTTTRAVGNSAGKDSSSKPTSASQAPGVKPRKPGGYKALMAQAQQGQQQKVGGIVHKPAMSAKERLKEAAEQVKASKGMLAKGKAGSHPTGKPGLNGKASTASNGLNKGAPNAGERYQGTARPNPSRPQPTYTGTARPSAKPQPQGYKGTARPGSAPISRAPSKPAKKYQRDEYLGTDEEDEAAYGYEDDDRYDEVSEDYSDMDAGFDDISDEEREAERQAKADDRKEQEILERQAREKAARKKAATRR